MTPREEVLQAVRAALGRSPGQRPPDPPPVRLPVPAQEPDARIAAMFSAIEALGGETFRASSPEEARAWVAAALQGRSAIASDSPYLEACGISGLPGVRRGFAGAKDLRDACATAGVGITSADYALADTGTLVLLSSPEEARLISLLPPAHVAVLPRERVLTGIEELFSILPRPVERRSSMVLVTGPSRTADIEQILVRGVHGPGRISVVVVG